jgi:hypothetical protein
MVSEDGFARKMADGGEVEDFDGNPYADAGQGDANAPMPDYGYKEQEEVTGDEPPGSGQEESTTRRRASAFLQAVRQRQSMADSNDGRGIAESSSKGTARGTIDSGPKADNGPDEEQVRMRKAQAMKYGWKRASP